MPIGHSTPTRDHHRVPRGVPR